MYTFRYIFGAMQKTKITQIRFSILDRKHFFFLLFFRIFRWQEKLFLMLSKSNFSFFFKFFIAWYLFLTFSLSLLREDTEIRLEGRGRKGVQLISRTDGLWKEKKSYRIKKGFVWKFWSGKVDSFMAYICLNYRHNGHFCFEI